MSAVITAEVEGVLRRALNRNEYLLKLGCATSSELDLLSVLKYAIESIDRHHKYFPSHND